jgi:hypothetical protein
MICRDGKMESQLPEISNLKFEIAADVTLPFHGG